MAKLRKSQIEQAYKESEKEINIFNKTLSIYVTESNPTMIGFLTELNKYRMNNYYSVKLLENLYNFTQKI